MLLYPPTIFGFLGAKLRKKIEYTKFYRIKKLDDNVF